MASKPREIPQEIVSAVQHLLTVAKKHDYKMIAAVFHPASNRIKAGIVTGVRTDMVDFRIMVEGIVTHMNEELSIPIVLGEDWLPYEQLAETEAPDGE